MINLEPFQERFPDDQSCKIHFKKLREAKKVICKKCSSVDHYWLRSKEQWECKKCHFRTTLKSGTILQASNLNFYTWYKTIFIIMQSDKILNSSDVKRILGLKRYEPVWYMMHKLRTLMLVKQNSVMNESEKELGEGILEFKNRSVHFGQLRKILESLEVEKQSHTHVIKVKYGKFERLKIVPYYDLISRDSGNLFNYSINHLRGTLDGRKSFFRNYFTINCYQKFSRKLGLPKETNSKEFKRYANEVYDNWRTVSYKYLQLYLDEVSFNINYKSRKTKIQVLVNQGINFNWYKSG